MQIWKNGLNSAYFFISQMIIFAIYVCDFIHKHGGLFMILAVSDLHLGYKQSNNKKFEVFLESYEWDNVDHFILLGDIFDFWRRNNTKIILENKDIIDKLSNLSSKIHYIVGNHDYYMLNLAKRYENNLPFKIYKSKRISEGGYEFYFTHGYEIEVLTTMEPLSIEAYEAFCKGMCSSEDIMGTVASKFWDLIHLNRRMMRTDPQNRLDKKITLDKKDKSKKAEKRDVIEDFACSKGKNLFLGMKNNEKLIFGHTHKPFIDKEGKAANTGSWVNEIETDYQNSYIEIMDGKMELKYF